MLLLKKTALSSVLLLSITVLAPAAPNWRAAHSQATHRYTSAAHRVQLHRQIQPHAISKVGTASFYSNHYNGRRTANGERFSNSALTAASNELPLGSRAKVTNLKNKRSVVVRVTDRGPFRAGRKIDLSRQAAQRLGFVSEGLAKVQITPVG